MKSCIHKTEFFSLVERLDCIDSNFVGSNGRVSGPNACEVKAHSKPWIVTLYGYQYRSDPEGKNLIQKCGGTLVSKNIVLTAAHCICLPIASNNAGTCVTKNTVAINTTHNVTQLSLKKVILGDHNTQKFDDGEVSIESFEIIAHEKFVTSKLPLPGK